MDLKKKLNDLAYATAFYIAAAHKGEIAESERQQAIGSEIGTAILAYEDKLLARIAALEAQLEAVKATLRGPLKSCPTCHYMADKHGHIDHAYNCITKQLQDILERSNG